MADKTEVERIVRSAYAARVAGDVDGVMRHFADQAQFSLAGSEAASPIPISATGIAAVREVMRRLVESFRFHEATVLHLLVDGDMAAVHWRLRVSAVGRGEEVETEILDLVRVSGGKIASLRQFADTALAARLIGG